MTRLVVLDNEAVQALADPTHRKHRQVVSHVQVVASRKRRAAAIEVVVPTSVRVETGWDRTSPAWAFPNHLRIADIPLDTAYANTAAAIHSRTGVSVADAHLGAVIQSAPAGQITVVTSDPGDMRLVAGDKNITVAAI
jgi:predicted nucleic acid-binding protein